MVRRVCGDRERFQFEEFIGLHKQWETDKDLVCLLYRRCKHPQGMGMAEHIQPCTPWLPGLFHIHNIHHICIRFRPLRTGLHPEIKIEMRKGPQKDIGLRLNNQIQRGAQEEGVRMEAMEAQVKAITLHECLHQPNICISRHTACHIPCILLMLHILPCSTTIQTGNKEDIGCHLSRNNTYSRQHQTLHSTGICIKMSKHNLQSQQLPQPHGTESSCPWFIQKQANSLVSCLLFFILGFSYVSKSHHLIETARNLYF